MHPWRKNWITFTIVEDKTQQIQAPKQKNCKNLNKSCSCVQSNLIKKNEKFIQTNLTKTRLKIKLNYYTLRNRNSPVTKEDEEAISRENPRRIWRVKRRSGWWIHWLKSWRMSAALEIHVTVRSFVQAQHQLQDQLKNQTRLETKANPFWNFWTENWRTWAKNTK